MKGLLLKMLTACLCPFPYVPLLSHGLTPLQVRLCVTVACMVQWKIAHIMGWMTKGIFVGEGFVQDERS